MDDEHPAREIEARPFGPNEERSGGLTSLGVLPGQPRETRTGPKEARGLGDPERGPIPSVPRVRLERGFGLEPDIGRA